MSMTKGRRGFLQRLMGTVGLGAAATAASSNALAQSNSPRTGHPSAVLPA